MRHQRVSLEAACPLHPLSHLFGWARTDEAEASSVCPVTPDMGQSNDLSAIDAPKSLFVNSQVSEFRLYSCAEPASWSRRSPVSSHTIAAIPPPTARASTPIAPHSKGVNAAAASAQGPACEATALEAFESCQLTRLLLSLRSSTPEPP